MPEGNCSCEINATLDNEASFRSFEGITNSELKDQVFTLDVSSIDFSEENCSYEGKKCDVEDGKQKDCA